MFCLDLKFNLGLHFQWKLFTSIICQKPSYDVKKKFQTNSNILIAGDFNIIPEEIDVHDFKRYENDALGRLEIRKKYRELINLGFKDVYRFKNKTKQEYTFWDYFAGSWQKNYGMRIDILYFQIV